MAKNKELGMKWFHFLIYFVLWLNAGAYVLLGFLLLGFAVDTLDMVYAGILLGFAVFCLITRSRLAKFKKGAPGCLYAVYILGNVVLVLFFNIISWMVTSGSLTDLVAMLLDPSLLSAIVGTIIAVAINKVYFNKRKHLFVN